MREVLRNLGNMYSYGQSHLSNSEIDIDNEFITHNFKLSTIKIK